MGALFVLGLGGAGDDELVVAPFDAETAAAVGPLAFSEIELAIALGTLLGHAVTVPRTTMSYSLQEIGLRRPNWLASLPVFDRAGADLRPCSRLDASRPSSWSYSS